jgi:DivIVA domain-containing protein
MTGDEIRTADFREKIRGYNPQDVDEALERLADRIDEAGSLRAADLDALRFRWARFRGYHPADVDALIERLKAEA